jgi:hypothetical protein
MEGLMFTRYLIWSLLLLAFLGSSCSPKQQQLEKKPSESALVPSALAPKKSMKPGAPVNLVEPKLVQLNAGHPEVINLRLQVPSTGKLRVNLSASEGLQLIGADTSHIFELSNGEVSFPVHLTAALEGRFYLNVDVVLETDESRTARNMAVVVQVGQEQAKAFKPSAQAAQTRDVQQKGEAVISMPAQETIKP